jgi:3-dehydroquinate dehydratase-2
MLGKRNPDVYGSFTMQDINQLLAETYPEVDFTFYQSNHEGALIDLLQGSDEYDMLVINAGGLSHYSVSLRDAFELVTCKKAVVHLSDIEQRESFRHIDLLKPLADVYVKGLKAQSYVLAIKDLIEKHLH